MTDTVIEQLYQRKALAQAKQHIYGAFEWLPENTGNLYLEFENADGNLQIFFTEKPSWGGPPYVSAHAHKKGGDSIASLRSPCFRADLPAYTPEVLMRYVRVALTCLKHKTGSSVIRLKQFMFYDPTESRSPHEPVYYPSLKNQLARETVHAWKQFTEKRPLQRAAAHALDTTEDTPKLPREVIKKIIQKI